ncbi:unnamed protein product [Urochloa humidicola]
MAQHPEATPPLRCRSHLTNLTSCQRACCSTFRVPPRPSLRHGRTGRRCIIFAGINIAEMPQAPTPRLLFSILEGCARRCAKCSRRGTEKQEKEISLCHHATFPIEQNGFVAKDSTIRSMFEVPFEDIRDGLVSQESGHDTVGQENGTEDDTLGQENCSGDEPIGQGTGTRGDDLVSQENGTADDPIGQDIGTGDDSLGQGNARNNLQVPDEKRRAIFEALLGRAKNGNLKAGETKEVSIQFSVPIRTVQRIWKKGKNCLDQGLGVDVRTEKNRCGRKKKVVDVSKLQNVPLSSRTTIDDVAKHLGVSKAKVQRMKKEGLIRRVSNSIKPYLTDKNKKDRLRWCLCMLLIHAHNLW